MDDNHLLQYVVRKYNIKCDDGTTNQDVISEIYHYLDKNYRNEYFYKNTLINKLIIGAHRLNTTTVLTELPISKSIADVIMINGKAIVYEIKTELDGFDRLETQLSDYYKAFDHVCVVTSESHLSSIKRILEDTPIGIYVITKRGSIRKYKEPQKYGERLDNEIIIKLLNKSEYESIIKHVYGKLPKTTPVMHYSVCKDLLLKIPLDDLYIYTLQELKKRNNIESYDFTNIPYALRFLVYFSRYNTQKYKEFLDFLDTVYLED